MANALPTAWLRFFSKRKNMKNSPYDGAKKKEKLRREGWGCLLLIASQTKLLQ